MPSLILQTGSRAVFHTILLLSIYFFASGHNAPGGGFIGGLVAGGAFVIRFIAEGAEDLRAMVRVRPEQIMGAGLVLAAAVGILGIAQGDFLESVYYLFDLPVLGQVSISSAVVFDGGVYLVVVGLVISILLTLGRER